MKTVHLYQLLLVSVALGWGVFGCTERGQVLRAGPASQDAHVDVKATADTGAPAPVLDAALGAANFVSVGTSHACFVEAGVAYCWGQNAAGQLGTGDTASRLVPTRVSSDEVWVSIQTGINHSCALTTRGEVLCWGGNERGQLGQGDRSSRDTPTKVLLPGQVNALDTRFSHSCAVADGGELYCWGENSEGQLGQADEYPGDNSTEADGLGPLRVGSEIYRSVSVGQGHSCGVVDDSSLRCFGRNSHHELGGEGPVQIREPIVVESSEHWQSVYAGQNHTCALTEAGALWCWGRNTGNATGDGAPLGIPTLDQGDLPTQLAGRQTWLSFATDTFHSCAIDSTAALWCWGRNIEGQLGIGDNQTRQEPSLVAEDYQAVDVGRFATCAVSLRGEVSCAGNNEEGILGNGNTSSHNALANVRR